MRINELLTITPEDFIGNNRFLIRGLKRSQNYIITLPVLQLSSAKKSDVRWLDPIITWSYCQVWRWCVKCGIGQNRQGRKTVARTHSHRYQTAEIVVDKINRQASSDVLHHRSRRSVNYYLQKKEGLHGKNQ